VLLSCYSNLHVQISCGTLDPGPLNQRPARNRRATRKVIEDTTDQVSLIETVENQEDARRSDLVSATGNHQVDNVPVPPPTLPNEMNPSVNVHATPLPNPRVMPSTETRFWATSPSLPSQTACGPQRGRNSAHFTVGRRSVRRPIAGKARNKNRHAASDVWTFFEDAESKRSCLFCK
jgi:hypothetical protein